ncbi:MAG: hypothetical protein KC466_05760, partial [Myxococcales bacterium]|nr:hypothetical protein [Myxococcales bacterium]
MKRVRQVLFLVLGLLVAYVAYGWIANAPDRWFGPFEGGPRPVRSAGERGGKQILFGDLHAHTTISADAAMMGFPIFGGQGFALPMEACQFARNCAGLDFWSIND